MYKKCFLPKSFLNQEFQHVNVYKAVHCGRDIYHDEKHSNEAIYQQGTQQVHKKQPENISHYVYAESRPEQNAWTNT